MRGGGREGGRREEGGGGREGDGSALGCMKKEEEGQKGEETRTWLMEMNYFRWNIAGSKGLKIHSMSWSLKVRVRYGWRNAVTVKWKREFIYIVQMIQICVALTKMADAVR